MIIAVVALVLIFACFAGVIAFGAPYLPTLTPQVNAALKLSELKKGDTFLELGCGDGKVLLAAAKQGINGVGYELNPILALIARIRTWRYRRQVHIICGNFWNKQWPEANVIFTFLLPKYMQKLHKKCIQYNHKPVKLISFAFTIPDQAVAKELSHVYRYDYR